MKQILIMLSIAVLVINASILQANETTTLRISTWAGSEHPINKHVLEVWASQINEESNGEIKLEFLHDIAHPSKQLEIVSSQVADIGWTFHGFSPGQFVLTKVAEFPPSRNITAEQISVAFWRTFKTHLESQQEHNGTKVLGVGAHAPGHIISTTPIDSIDDLSNARIRVGSGVMSDVAKLLDLSYVSLPTPELYQSLSQGVADASFSTLELLRSMNLVEVAPYVYRFPEGLYSGTFSIFINARTWNNLTESQQLAIEKVSYEPLSRLFGSVMQQAESNGIEYAVSQGATVNEATVNDRKEVQSISHDLQRNWVTEIRDKYNVNGHELLDYFNNELERIK